MDLKSARHDAGRRLLARHAQEAVARGGAAAGAAAALPRRAVRGDRRGRLAADQGSAARRSSRAAARSSSRRTSSRSSSGCRRTSASSPTAGSSRRARSRSFAPGGVTREDARGAVHRAWSAASKPTVGARLDLTDADESCARSPGCAGACCINSLERTGARDTLERFSLAVEQLGPIIALALLVPVGHRPRRARRLRRLLARRGPAGDDLRSPAVPACSPPAASPSSVRCCCRRWSRPPRAAAAAADSTADAVRGAGRRCVRRAMGAHRSARRPVSAPVGLVLGTRCLPPRCPWRPAPPVVCLIGLSTLSTLLLHLVARDRRRGELLALLFMSWCPPWPCSPGCWRADTADQTASGTAGAARRPCLRGSHGAPKRRSPSCPSELFVRATRSSARHEPGAAAMPLLVLPTSGALLHMLGSLIFARLLDAPSAGTRRRSVGSASSTSLRLPFLSRGSAAVAQAQLRLTMRTPRGRSIAARTVRRFRDVRHRDVPPGPDGERILQPHQRPEHRHVRLLDVPPRDPAVCHEPVRDRPLGTHDGLTLAARDPRDADGQSGGYWS